MDKVSMELKILLPWKVFADIGGVKRIIAETTDGSYGFWPGRLDCAAALVTGILTYETADSGVHYLAVTDGMLVKAGAMVYVAVRDAMGDAPLGELKSHIEKEQRLVSEKEQDIRIVMGKLETSLLRSIQKLAKP